MNRIPGMWSGPSYTSTTAGNSPMWYVDFRPVSSNQICQYSLWDPGTSENISFFVVKFNGELKLAMRTEGCSATKCCATYEVLDSASEQNGYYRFSDFVRGKKRAVSIIKFTGDSMTVTVYTNKFNQSDSLLWHSTWKAKLATRNNATQAIRHFSYPQQVMTLDLTNAFKNMNESIFYTIQNDPYTLLNPPYMGSITCNITVQNGLTLTPSDKIFLLFTVEPLFSGIAYLPENIKYTSKYVLLSSAINNYTLNNVHPGQYYVYALVDKNQNGTYDQGDYMNSNVSQSLTVSPSANVPVNVAINYIIP
ncbi:MAG: hypothetical protein WCO44_09575 [Bacteroidota bacterium]